MPRIKLRGERSLESKLSRLAYELEHDASRIRADHKEQGLADAVQSISHHLGNLSRGLHRYGIKDEP